MYVEAMTKSYEKLWTGEFLVLGEFILRFKKKPVCPCLISWAVKGVQRNCMGMAKIRMLIWIYGKVRMDKARTKQTRGVKVTRGQSGEELVVMVWTCLMKIWEKSSCRKGAGVEEPMWMGLGCMMGNLRILVDEETLNQQQIIKKRLDVNGYACKSFFKCKRMRAWPCFNFLDCKVCWNMKLIRLLLCFDHVNNNMCKLLCLFAHILWPRMSIFKGTTN